MSIIRIEKYVTQTGQLQRTAVNEYGSTSVTTVNTVKCLVYQEGDSQDPTNPTVTREARHFVIFPPETDVMIDDQLKDVIDQFGTTIFTPARRIVAVTDYNHWQVPREFRQAQLEAKAV